MTACSDLTTAPATLETISGWEIRNHGPGYWASDEADKASVWLEGNLLHYESVSDWTIDIPLAVIDRLRELDKEAMEATVG